MHFFCLFLSLTCSIFSLFYDKKQLTVLYLSLISARMKRQLKSSSVLSSIEIGRHLPNQINCKFTFN